jgi:predicted ATPase/DNA-binding winged helix-turn-helix (wHTH) protein
MRGESQRFFSIFRLDVRNAQLWRGEEPISLRPKTFDVLRHLVEHPGELVTKMMLLDGVWPSVSVSDSLPATCVKELRRALGDDAVKPRFIETVQRRGYRFIAPVSTQEPQQPTKQVLVPANGSRAIVVGRERELEQLRGWYSDVGQGHRRVVFIAGEAGIGKSTFTQLFIDDITRQGRVRVGRGQCVEQYGTGEPYMPVLEALNRLGHEVGGEQIIRVLRRYAPTWLGQMPSLLQEEDPDRVQTPRENITQQRMLREMTQALDALAAESPLVLLIEDLHWSDHSTLELISAIARRREPAQLLVIGTYRPVEMLTSGHPLRAMKEELHLHRYCEELRLKLLVREEVRGYLARRFLGAGTQRWERLAPIIHKRTDGNPLFMVNVVDYLVEAGKHERSVPGSEETISAVRLDAPRTIRQLIERNLERLQPEEQMVLEGASAVGAEFSAASVAAALERSQTEVEACCTRLSRHEQFVSMEGAVTWPDGTVAAGFKFQHALYQEVLYDRLSVSHRLQLHQRIAVREEAGFGDRADEVATELAHHYSLANVKLKAIQYFQLAGERAAARGAMIEAEEQYRCALKLLEELPQTAERDHRELVLQLAVGSALVAIRGWTTLETERAYARARELCDRLGASPELSPALFGIYAMYLVRGEVDSASALAQQLLQLANSAEDPSLTLYAQVALGVSSYFKGEFLTALEHLEAAISIYDLERHKLLALRYGFDAGVWSLSYASAALWLLGYPDRALKRKDESLRLAHKLAHPLMLAQAELWESILRQFRQEGELLLSTTNSAIGRSTEYGLSNWLNWSGALQGWARAILGRPEEGIDQISKSRAALEEKGARVWRPYFLCLLAEGYVRANRIEDGLIALADAFTTADEHGEREHQAEIDRLKGELLLAGKRSNAGDAQRCFERAIQVAQKQNARSFELRATIGLARVLMKKGQLQLARAKLTAIYHWFTEGFDTIDLMEARALLDQLEARANRSERSQK